MTATVHRLIETYHESGEYDDVRVAALERLSQGGRRETYLADVVATTDESKGEKIVLRVGRDGDHARQMNVHEQYQLLASLSEDGVPVPRPLWYAEEPSRCLLATEYLPGRTLNPTDPEVRFRLYDEWDDGTRGLARSFVDALAAIHSASPNVDSIARGGSEDVVTDELDALLRRRVRFDVTEEPLVDEAIRWLRDNQPAVPETTLVHGDYHLGNLMIDDGTLAGVVDWEHARISDPMYDLAHATNRLYAGDVLRPVGRPTMVCALAKRDWVFRQYERATGRTVSERRIGYWRTYATIANLLGVYRLLDRVDPSDGSTLHRYVSRFALPRHRELLLAAIRDDRTR